MSKGLFDYRSIIRTCMVIQAIALKCQPTTINEITLKIYDINIYLSLYNKLAQER